MRRFSLAAPRGDGAADRAFDQLQTTRSRVSRVQSVILSVSATHALRAMAWLAAHGGDGAILGRDLAKKLKVPADYLSKVLPTRDPPPPPHGGARRARRRRSDPRARPGEEAEGPRRLPVQGARDARARRPA